MPARADQNCSGRPTIGIVAGSGPEAGIDLWSKVLKHNQAAFGWGFRGDPDAPRVVVVSEPQLGLSMDLARNDDAVWAAMEKTLAVLVPQVDAYAIACNTLNWYAPRIADLNLGAHFVSFQSVLAEWIARTGTSRLALLGAAPVTAMDAWSTYRGLSDLVEVELPGDPEAVHHLIEEVKRLGSGSPALRPTFSSLLAGLSSDEVILACTELPLISDVPTAKTLVDVTDLVAQALVAISLAGCDDLRSRPAHDGERAE